MIENKLKFMLENNKLDGLINNKSEAEKLCKLGTTEEVLDLLNKYNYNETKEVFERELLEILQEINLTEEELNNVSGGKISHGQEIAKFLGVVSLAGAINMPPKMAVDAAPVIAVDDTSVIAVEKKPVSAVDAAPVIAVEKEPVSAVDAASVRAVKNQKDKNSGWLSNTTEDKFAKISTGIVGAIGLGALFFYGGKKLLGLSGNEIKNGQLAELATLVAQNETWDGRLANVNSIVVSLIQKPVQKYTKLVKNISSEDLESYATKGLKLWCTNTKDYYDKNTRSITDANAWNKNFGLLVKIRWAVWLMLIKEKKVEDEILKKNVELRRFGKERFLGGNENLEWYEYYDGDGGPTKLTNPREPSFVLSPKESVIAGNVAFAIWSLTDDLPEEDPTGRCMKLKKEMQEIATKTLKNCMIGIPLLPCYFNSRR